MSDTTQKDLMTTEEAAEFLGIRKTTLETWRCLGRQPQPAFVRVGMRVIRYRRADLERFIAANVVGDESESV